MALSNAERQARFQQRLRERAAQADGVTPDMIRRAARIIYEYTAALEESQLTWDRFVAQCQQKRHRRDWIEMIPTEVGPDAYEFLAGEDRALVEKVAAVMNAAMVPPLPESELA